MSRSFEQEKEKISHRPTQTDTDICQADFAGQKKSSLREKKHEERGNRKDERPTSNTRRARARRGRSNVQRRIMMSLRFSIWKNNNL